MRRLNLSAWAVAHPTLIVFLILLLGVTGVLSYLLKTPSWLRRFEQRFFGEP